MSDYWTKKKAKDTFEIRKIIESDGEIIEEKYNFEHCLFCLRTEVDLFGLSHTGGFRGVCKDCLKKLNCVIGRVSEHD